MVKKKKFSHPILLLQDIESRSRKSAIGLPQQEEVKDEWSGIGFRVGDYKLAAPLGQVVEILTLPELSRVPGAKSWVMGIANVRGNLLPIIDLHNFLHGKQTQMKKKSRVLILNHEGVFSGLLVDEVMGMRRYLAENRRITPDDLDSSIKPYIEHIYQYDEQWLVFSMHKLADSSLFLQVAS
ncbi:MAG: purine-binding chemotaxis protein CheW [Gammaproteobacteria bacterium]|nr:purine-binding chemotaxis protein CheW [Gammaproteobacteria bacterium]